MNNLKGESKKIKEELDTLIEMERKGYVISNDVLNKIQERIDNK